MAAAVAQSCRDLVSAPVPGDLGVAGGGGGSRASTGRGVARVRGRRRLTRLFRRALTRPAGRRRSDVSDAVSTAERRATFGRWAVVSGRGHDEPATADAAEGHPLPDAGPRSRVAADPRPGPAADPVGGSGLSALKKHGPCCGFCQCDVKRQMCDVTLFCCRVVTARYDERQRRNLSDGLGSTKRPSRRLSPFTEA